MPTQTSPDMMAVLTSYRDAVNQALAQFFADLPGSMQLEVSEQSQDALDKVREYTLRPGKRIRGALASYAYDVAAGTRYGNAGLHAAVALELAQSYLLIIDDVMDRSDLRRGKLTVHRIYLEELPEQLNNEFTADMMAVNVGLVAQHLMNLALSDAGEEPGRVVSAMQVLHRNIAATSLGQLDDLYQQIGQPVSEQDIIRKYTFKSSYYTFVNPLQLGLVLGGVNDPAVLREVEVFGTLAGIAFQLHDDVLGVYGTEGDTGKSTLDDIKEGKYTLLVHHALQHAPEADKGTLQRHLGNQGAREQDAQQVRDIMERAGSRSFVEEKALYYAEKAKGCLASSAYWNGQSQRLLQDIVDYCIQRTA